MSAPKKLQQRSTNAQNAPAQGLRGRASNDAMWKEAKADLGGGFKALVAPVGGGPTEQQVGDLSLLPRILRMAKPYIVLLSIGLFCVLLSALLGLAALHFYEPLIDSIATDGTVEDLTRFTLLMIALYIVQSLTGLSSGYLLGLVSMRVIMDLRLRIYEHLQSLPVGFFTERRTGELVSRVMNDAASVNNVVTGELAGALRQVVTIVGALVMIFFTNWKLSLFMIILVPGVAAFAIFMGRIIRRLSTQVTDRFAAVTTVLEESLSGIRSVRSFVREDYEIGRFRSSLSQLLSLALRRLYLQVIFSPVVSLLFFSTSVVLIWFGGKQVIQGELTIGALGKFIALTSTMAGSIYWFGGLWTRLQAAMGSCQRMFELLDTKPTLVEMPNAQPLPAVQGQITFEGVGLRYSSNGSEPDPTVLEDISIDVSPGEVLAVVGPSGAGKTSLINLVPRFYDPTAGRVMLDGQDLRGATFASVREQVGLVPQEAQLFAGTVRQNILYGRLDATEEEMITAAEAANAHEFVQHLPQGYDTVVGERATKISGGQKQRIAIARALLKDPRILLLDEATSALDTESERLVQEALERLMKGRTSLVVAHRLSTVKHADRIAVLDRGRLVELGSHDELMSLDGLYARLYRHQFREQTEASGGEPT